MIFIALLAAFALVAPVAAVDRSNFKTCGALVVLSLVQNRLYSAFVSYSTTTNTTPPRTPFLPPRCARVHARALSLI